MASVSVCLVACVKSKKTIPAPAGELYTSPLFRKSINYALSHCDHYFILSAKHGLLSPETVIPPYEQTLRTMRKPERDEWAAKVQEQLRKVLKPGNRVMFLAGEKYREGLVPFLKAMGCKVVVPMEGLSFGQQLAWLGKHSGA